MRHLLAALIFATGVSLIGCDRDDPYADAPSATAQQTGQSDRSNKGGAGRLPSGSSDELPPGHPPVQNDQAAGGSPSTSSGAQPDNYETDDRQGVGGQTGGSASAGGQGGPHRRGPLTWSIPEPWKSVPPSTQMRLAEYRVPGTDSSNPANLGVFHFGRRGGGDVQSNIDRWVGQFSAPDGGKPDATIDKEQLSGGNMVVHTVDVSGTYSPGVGMGGGQSQDNRRMLAAIVDSPDGLYFFKLVGPTATVTAAEGDFDTLIDSLSFDGA